MKFVLRRRLLKCSNENGFSLVEVIVTISLISLIALILISMTSQLRSIQAVNTHNDVKMEVEALANYVGKLVSGARPISIKLNSNQDKAVLVGSADKLSFVGLVKVSSQTIGLRNIRLFLKSDPANGASNMLSLQTELRRARGNKGPQQIDLSPIDSIKFSYWTGDTWAPQWRMKSKLPEAIAFTLIVNRENKEFTARRVVKLRSATN